MQRRSEMSEQAQEWLALLDTLGPDNICQKTNATWGQAYDFQGLWYNHTPQAARYFLLPRLADGSFTFNEA